MNEMGASPATMASFPPTVPTIPVVPKVVHDFKSDRGSIDAHEIPLALRSESSSLVDKISYLDSKGSIGYKVSFVKNYLKQLGVESTLFPVQERDFDRNLGLISIL